MRRACASSRSAAWPRCGSTDGRSGRIATPTSRSSSPATGLKPGQRERRSSCASTTARPRSRARAGGTGAGSCARCGSSRAARSSPTTPASCPSATCGKRRVPLVASSSTAASRTSRRRSVTPRLEVQVRAPGGGPPSSPRPAPGPRAAAPGRERPRALRGAGAGRRAEALVARATRCSTTRSSTRSPATRSSRSTASASACATSACADGLLELNGRQLELRGASIQEDLEGHGPGADATTTSSAIVGELKALGANVTRAHYLLNERLLRRARRGRASWSGARPRSTTATACWRPTRSARTALSDGARDGHGRALATRRVITHSVANELSVIPDEVAGTRRLPRRRPRADGRPRPDAADQRRPAQLPRLRRSSETYAHFDLLGINSYFGWYPGKKSHSTASIADLGPFLRRRCAACTRRQGLVLTEFGAESTIDGPGRRQGDLRLPGGLRRARS